MIINVTVGVKLDKKTLTKFFRGFLELILCLNFSNPHNNIMRTGSVK